MEDSLIKEIARIVRILHQANTGFMARVNS